MKLKMAADQVLKRFSRQIRKEDALSQRQGAGRGT
jgi:ribosomal protein S21